MTVTVAADVRGGIEEMSSVPSGLTVKQPAAGPDGHGSRTTGVPACCSAVVPISIAVAPVRLLPPTVTAMPPAIVLLRRGDGDAGRCGRDHAGRGRRRDAGVGVDRGRRGRGSRSGSASASRCCR